MSATAVNRLRQVLIVALGLAVAAGMLVLGVWQLDVYRAQGADAAARRATGTPVLLSDVAPAGAAVGDGFGRPVRFSGSYVPSLQLLIPVAGQPGAFRVLTGLKQGDGSIVAVVRGRVLTQTSAHLPKAPAPPAGELDQFGVLLPSDQAVSSASGDLTGVNLPALAQHWPGPLVGGYVTLSAADAETQGLAPAAVDLPQGKGRLRNGAYAVQWWLFAAFAVAMSLRMARDLGRQADWSDTDEIDAGATVDAA